MAEAARTDHEGRRSGDQQVQRPLDRVVRRQPRVGERRGVDRVERRRAARGSAGPGRAGASPCRRRTRARSPPWDAWPGSRSSCPSLTRHRAQYPQPHAPWTATGVPDLEPLGTRADGLDPARVLVAERERRVEGEEPGRELVEEVEVGVAGAGAADADDDLAGTGRRVVDLDELGVVLPGGELKRAHDADATPTGRSRPRDLRPATGRAPSPSRPGRPATPATG